MIDKELERSSDAHWRTALPHVSVDCVVFGFSNSSLNVLILKIKNEKNWILPGGYVFKDESLDDAAKRVLFERSGAERIFLNVFGVFGDINRSENYFAAYKDDLWHKQRFITVGYYALVDQTNVTPIPDSFSESCEWVSINQLPTMVMDHELILKKALKTLREQLSYKPIGYNLMPKTFTMPELQSLYETILGQKLNRGNFYRKIMRYDILIKLDEPRKGGAHKAPHLYRFDEEKYKKALNELSW
ncbi:NUDIX hydrolase [Pedobacter mucosus]|uniref:NUDIX hydrolase n=1 Tax=Pedobacter mucosus TaxID=2895286 RepID=UPI001EE3C6A0|nr:NUDIX domain-containing protein [Pedobacter mucosus]UKT63984.1 NUDIX domain-containing protein [Pedobacter mucosus]